VATAKNREEEEEEDEARRCARPFKEVSSGARRRVRRRGGDRALAGMSWKQLGDSPVPMSLGARQ
jgi:hypothetical protein